MACLRWFLGFWLSRTDLGNTSLRSGWAQVGRQTINDLSMERLGICLPSLF